MSRVSLSTLLTVLLSSLLVGGTTFVCDQNSTRKTGSTTYCGSANAVLCQGVQEASLTVECWTCPLGRPVNWTVTYTSGHKVELNTANNSLSLTASEMRRTAEGCYQCQCDEAGVSFGVNFSVKVAPGDKPHFSVPHGRLEGNVYELLPYPLDITLNASVIGEIVVDCSATGYPEPSYTWQVNDGDINDSCVRVDFEEGGKKLIFIPTPWNTREQNLMSFSCTVQNGLPDGTIIGKQQLKFESVDEWLLHPHPAQSGSVVHLTDGLATGVVAACDASTFGIYYFICANMTAVAPADNPACSVDLYMNEGKCCPCNSSPCFKNLDLTMKTVEVTDSEGLGLSTAGCNFTTSTEQHLLFFARRYLSALSGSSKFPIYQLIGYTDVKKEQKPIPSPEPPAVGTGSVSESALIGSAVGIVIVAVVLGTLFCVIAVGIGYRFGKKHSSDPDTSSTAVRNRRGAVYQALQTTPVQGQGQGQAGHEGKDVPSVTVHTGPGDRHHFQTAARSTNPNAFECVIPDQIKFETDKEYNIVVNCGNQSVSVSFTVAKCSCIMETSNSLTESGRRGKALYVQVQKRQVALIDGINLDGNLLAQLHQRGLVTKKEYNDINAFIKGLNVQDAGTYFINSVLFRWPIEVFESNVRLLIEALKSDGERGNRSVARKLCNAFSKCGLAAPRLEDPDTSTTDSS